MIFITINEHKIDFFFFYKIYKTLNLKIKIFYT